MPAEGAPCRLRCYDCLGRPHYCETCLLRTHRRTPFHRIWQWSTEDGFWHKTTTGALGMKLWGGHNGAPCPNITRDPRMMVFVHEHGVSSMACSFCECAEMAGGEQLVTSEPLQLVEMGLYPASWKQPRTAYTITLLESYHLLSLQTHCSAEDFYTYLRRKTDNVAPKTVPDRYRELSNSAREFAYLRQCKRAGEMPGKTTTRGSLTVKCPCCPQPGINMRVNWKDRCADYSYLDALFYSIDGNFRQSQRNKPMDKNDVALSRGAGYFADVDDFREYASKIGKPEPELTTCHKFGAAGYGGHNGKVSGIIALACRHMFMLPGSIVDLNKREAYLYVDFAVVSGMQPYVGLRLVKQTYDIACQYLINFGRRLEHWKQLCLPLASITTFNLPRTEGAIGLWHSLAHQILCRIFKSPEFMPGSGRYEGEGMERLWAITNDVSARTKEMTSGHRHDVLNDVYSDLHVRRVHNIGMMTLRRTSLNEAERFLQETTEALEKLEQSVSNDKLTEWRRDEAKWLRDVVDFRNHEHMEDPYSPHVDAALSEAGALKVLKEDKSKTSGLQGVGMVSAIQEMIEIEREKLRLTKKVREADPLKTRQRNALGRRVLALQGQAEVCRRQYERFVGERVTAAVEDIRLACRSCGTEGASVDAFPLSCDRGGETSNDSGTATDTEYLEMLHAIHVELPSYYTTGIRTHPKMEEAVSIEQKLREGQAKDALDELRTHLTALYSLEDLRGQGTGQAHGQRVKALAATEVAIGHQARDEYRRVRKVLVELGMPEDDKTFRILTDEDAKPFIVFSHQHRRGDSKRTGSWLWEDFSFANDQGDNEVKEYMYHKIRPFWFRKRAARARWQEEVYIKREEMYRTTLFFEYYRDRWSARGMDAAEDGREGAMVYARRQSHRYARLLADARHAFPSDVSMVRKGQCGCERELTNIVQGIGFAK
ncbi:hypothetical protein C8Q73DRAFT_644132 [Cubamyces lactineus]|nr:hypothetical protein C8Q73DRAFT_661225 [Cubamyces lactineus]KAH9896033.1 hypothetical protein C8Q73DRAFT_644132 [Cubamyces lactineus]